MVADFEPGSAVMLLTRLRPNVVQFADHEAVPGPQRTARHARLLGVSVSCTPFQPLVGLLLTFGLALPHRDMLELSQVTGGWSFEWSRAHFGAWCIMSSPLILGLDLLSSVQMEQMWPIVTDHHSNLGPTDL